MKIRNGFVSNSSSSSFVCPVCGKTTPEILTIYADLYKFAICECEHACCEEHLVEINDEEYKQKAIELLTEISQDPFYEFHMPDLIQDLSSINNINRERIEKIVEKYFYTKYLDSQCPICSKRESSK
jgi:hypothetical protein